MEIYKKIINAKHRLPWFFPKKCPRGILESPSSARGPTTLFLDCPIRLIAWLPGAATSSATSSPRTPSSASAPSAEVPSTSSSTTGAHRAPYDSDPPSSGMPLPNMAGLTRSTTATSRTRRSRRPTCRSLTTQRTPPTSTHTRRSPARCARSPPQP
eukprot:1106560-Prymnesium_polylepis.1